MARSVREIVRRRSDYLEFEESAFTSVLAPVELRQYLRRENSLRLAPVCEQLLGILLGNQSPDVLSSPVGPLPASRLVQLSSRGVAYGFRYLRGRETFFFTLSELYGRLAPWLSFREADTRIQILWHSTNVRLTGRREIKLALRVRGHVAPSTAVVLGLQVLEKYLRDLRLAYRANRRLQVRRALRRVRANGRYLKYRPRRRRVWRRRHR
jgi:hypothetical protein